MTIRGYATFFVVAVMTLGVMFLLLTKVHTAYDAPPEELVADAGEAGAADASIVDAAVLDAGPPKPTVRPTRVTTLGWELAAPAVALAMNDAGPALEVAPETALDAVEARLARGGADQAGADIAVMPLPSFIASYERLRALEPRAFLVVGFSHGREELHAAPNALSKAPPGADEVKMIALGPATAGDVTARAAGTDSATILGLFALDVLGVAPSRVHLVAPGSDAAKNAPLAAIARGASDDRKLAFSTTDASRLVPLVAIAPKAVLENDAKRAELVTFARAWFDGISRASKDASAVARKLASKDGVPLSYGVGGAPEAIALLERLGQIDATPLEGEVALLGPTAKGAVTLETLTQKTWQLARGGGLTSSAAPDPLPIDARVATAIATPAPVKPKEDADADAGAFPALPTGATLLVVYRADLASDAADVATHIGFLAGVFQHAAFRVTAKGGEKSARAIAAQAKDRFDLPMTRLATTTAEPAGAFASVEVLALP